MNKKSKIEPISRPCINISVIECWRCKNDLIVPYYTNYNGMPLGPSSFTDLQIDFASHGGCILRESFSKITETSYIAAVCPVCGSMMDNFLYYNFANIPGDVQYFLDENDGILKRIVNKRLKLRNPNNFDASEMREDIDSKPGSTVSNPKKSNSCGECALVKFEVNRIYKYNCRFEVKVGDKVRVDGKMSDKIGKVVEIVGEWENQQIMKEIVEILPPEFEDVALNEETTQQKNDEKENQDDESANVPYISGLSLEYRVIIDDSNPDSPFKVWFDTFDLCNEKLRDIEIHSSATIKSNCFRVSSISYVQFEYSFGGEFTCYENYVFDRLNTEKLYQSLNQSLDLIQISEIIKQEFGGPLGLQRLEAYCKEKEISYKYIHRYEE